MGESNTYPRLSVTFVVEFNGRFLLVHRGSNEKNFGDYWAFTGGRTELQETVIETIRRETLEEVGLEITDEGAFLNSYWFGSSVGVTFLVRATSNNVQLGDGLLEHQWIASLDDMREYRCIPGIYNHLVDAQLALKHNLLRSLEDMNLTFGKYHNAA